jgi:hypothetical protein
MSGGVGRTTDISQMSPEERASRLFDRVMRHQEAGQVDSMRFFLPMALQAHQMLASHTEDSRFHLGLLQLANENPAGAIAQADSIQRMTSDHLFIYVLRARALTERGDAAGARRAYSDYLRAEAAERGKQRPEYTDHSTTLDLFRNEARQRSGG